MKNFNDFYLKNINYFLTVIPLFLKDKKEDDNIKRYLYIINNIKDKKIPKKDLELYLNILEVIRLDIHKTYY